MERVFSHVSLEKGRTVVAVDYFSGLHRVVVHEWTGDGVTGSEETAWKLEQHEVQCRESR